MAGVGVHLMGSAVIQIRTTPAASEPYRSLLPQSQTILKIHCFSGITLNICEERFVALPK